MGPASKTSRNTSSSHIGEVDTVVKLEPKMMVKEEMTGVNKEHGKEKKRPNSKLFRPTFSTDFGIVLFWTFGIRRSTVQAKGVTI